MSRCLVFNFFKSFSKEYEIKKFETLLAMDAYHCKFGKNYRLL